MDCCGQKHWRAYIYDLQSGDVIRTVPFISATFGTGLNDFGRGTAVLPLAGIQPADIWPMTRGIAFARIAGLSSRRSDGYAEPDRPEVEWAGYVETFSLTWPTVSLGLKSMEAFTQRRVLRRTLSYNGTEQRTIARNLATQARVEPNGTSTQVYSLVPEAYDLSTSSITRDRTYPAWERSNIGELLQNLANVENGVEWQVRYKSYLIDTVRSYMAFGDSVGVDLTPDNGDRETVRIGGPKAAVNAWGLTVDGSEAANRVDAIGAGEEDQRLISTYDGRLASVADAYPHMDSVISHPDVTRVGTLSSHAIGEGQRQRYPTPNPSFSLRGLHRFDPERYLDGNRIYLDMNLQLFQYTGSARIIARNWTVDQNGEELAVTLMPTSYNFDTFRSREATGDQCEDC